MKELKESTVTVRSKESDEIGSKRGKIEGIYGEGDGEDMVVDVVSGDEVAGGKGDSGEETGTGTGDCVVEDVGVVKESLEKVEVVVSEEEGGKGSVEVVKEVVKENVVVSSVVSGLDADAASEPSSKEIEVKEFEVKESDKELGDGHHVGGEKSVKSLKEAEVLKSSKVPESTEGEVVVEEGLVGKDKDEESVDNQGSSNEAVNADVGSKNTGNEGGVGEIKEDSVQLAVEASGNGTAEGDSEMVVELDRGVTEKKVEPEPELERPTESVQEDADGDGVMSEKSGKDEILDSAKSSDSVTKGDEVGANEGLAGKDETKGDVSHQGSLSSDKPSIPTEDAVSHRNDENVDPNAEVDQTKKEESSQPAIEGGTHDATESGKETEVGDAKMDVEPEIIEGENVIDKGDKETSEQPVNSVQEVAKVDHESSKAPQSSIMASLGLEDVDVVAVDESLEGKNDAQDSQSKTNEVPKVGTSEVDEKTEADSTSKDENSFATIKPEEVAAGGKVDEVTIAQKEPKTDVQGSTDGGNLVENQSGNANTVADSSKPEEVACTEPETSVDKVAPGIANKDFGTDAEAEIVKVEPASTGHGSSDHQVDQGLNANHSNPGDEITTSHTTVQDSKVEVPPETSTEHGVLPVNSELSYEEAHMERAEDAGMDIDEVLGWKDEVPSVQEGEPKVDPTNLSNVEVQEPEKENKTSVSLQQSSYFRPPENEGQFSVSDLVWGKVKSHPWWPGQIFDPADASEKAMKFHKKDCFLVAYFGDRTFGWNDSTVLKPFRENFSQIVEHINSEAFNNAVHCALEEVSRRVELGLTCPCIPRDIYENIKYQIVENSGIKQESSRRHSVDQSASVNSFEPDMLVDYVRLLATFPYDAGDKMELTMAKAQLSSYGRFKGHRQLAEFQVCGDLVEAEQVVKDETHSEDGSKKRKALESVSEGPEGPEKRPALQTDTSTPKPAFQVGESIQKVATQLTGPPEQLSQSQEPTQLGNQADMLSQLHLAAQDPRKGYGFVNNIIPYFNSHRTAVLNKSRLGSSNDAKKRKIVNENGTEEFEFDDVNDSYWTDRIIQNYSEENPLQENQNGVGLGQHQVLAYEQETKPVKQRRSNKKRFFSSNHEIEAKEQSELIERRRKNLATEVLMKFTEGIYFPSEIHLNKMFRRFGPLMESETEVDRQAGRARVVFKKCSDAEVAHSSAGKFNIFGSINVHYELNYTPLISYKPLPVPVAQDQAH